jgi:membrane associated rhomboid family serine protease
MNEPAQETLIAARNKREAMDFGLVLASQEIEATVIRDEYGWAVSVLERDYDRALTTLAQWKKENRGWQWRNPLPKAVGRVFHWTSLVWACATAAIYVWSLAPGIKDAGVVDNTKVAAGEWWRLFTAVTLHADLAHLLSNITTGLILFGLAMARFGTGPALLATFISGALGNVASFYMYSGPYHGLGASGMVMGALGLLAVPTVEENWRMSTVAGLVLRGIAATFLMLTLLGFSPGTDIVAHLGGFVSGVALGLVMMIIPPKRLQDSVTNLATGGLFLAVMTASWWLALRGH